MIYLRAGLYAEGPTDYRFLEPLVERLLFELGATRLPGNADIAGTVGIDAPRGTRSRRREDRIAAAIDAHWDECTIFVVHSDGAGDPDVARACSIAPGIAKTREAHPDAAVSACVPVREVEAWMLCDAQAFVDLVGRAPELPLDPESVFDPKATLRGIFTDLGAKEVLGDSYRYFGQNVRFDSLRRLKAFRAFEAELDLSVQALASSSAH